MPIGRPTRDPHLAVCVALGTAAADRPYVRVEDVPASWDRYDAIARSIVRAPPGLLLHVAGPTDEGFRIVEVWRDEAAWRSFASHVAEARASVDPDLPVRAAVRDLRVQHVVLGRVDDPAERIGTTEPG